MLKKAYYRSLLLYFHYVFKEAHVDGRNLGAGGVTLRQELAVVAAKWKQSPSEDEKQTAIFHRKRIDSKMEWV